MKGASAQEETPVLLGAVDLGSNSFRVEIGRVEDYRITTESYWKETVRLAGGIDANDAFTPEIQERALATLRRFREKLENSRQQERNEDGVNYAVPDAFINSFFVPHTVVER